MQLSLKLFDYSMITYCIIQLLYNRKSNKKMGERAEPIKIFYMRTELAIYIFLKTQMWKQQLSHLNKCKGYR